MIQEILLNDKGTQWKKKKLYTGQTGDKWEICTSIIKD